VIVHIPFHVSFFPPQAQRVAGKTATEDRLRGLQSTERGRAAGPEAELQETWQFHRDAWRLVDVMGVEIRKYYMYIACTV